MDLSQAIECIRPSIVQIVFSAFDLSDEMSKQYGGRKWITKAIGTGFIVSPDGYVITANHVTKGGLELVNNFQSRTKNLLIGFAQENTENMRGNFTLVGFEIIDEDKRHDLALLKLNKNPFRGEVKSGMVINLKEIPLLFGNSKLNTIRPKDGVGIGISGYPLNNTVLITNSGIVATPWATNFQEISIPGKPEYFKTVDVADSYIADVNVNPGNSGGPVYLINDGSVIGVCVAYVRTNVQNDQGSTTLYYNSGLTMVVPTRYIIDLLTKNGLTIQ